MSKERTLVIPDIHGSAKGLEQVLEKAKVTDNDTIIQLGDVADGWSEVPECVDILLSLKNLISIRGNHDVWCYDWFKYGHTPRIWTGQGGQATIDAYVRAGKLEDPFHKAFWDEQQDWYIDDKNRLFIHAGWAYADRKPEWGADLSPLELFERQASISISDPYGNGVGTIAKECHWDRELLRGAKSGSIKSMADGTPTGFKALNLFNEVFIGHTATRDGLPHNYLNLWQMDTGAGWSGKLTIMDVDSKEFWQSENSMELYPNDKGRHG